MTDKLAKIREAIECLLSWVPIGISARGNSGIVRSKGTEALALLDSLSAPDAKGGQGEPGYWWCPECQEEVDARRVTFQEFHDTCGRHVVWKEPLSLPAASAPEPKSWAEDRERRIYAGEVLLDAPTVKDSLTVPAPEPFVSKENPTTHLIEILPNPDYEYITAPEPKGEELTLTNIGLARLICNDVTKFISIGRDSEGDPCGWDFATEKAAQHVQTILEARLSPPSPKEDE